MKVEGYDVVGSYGDADLVVVNTCGFIDEAGEESLGALGEAMAENGKVIVSAYGVDLRYQSESWNGLVYIDEPGDIRAGEFARVRIHGSDAHDLFARPA